MTAHKPELARLIGHALAPDLPEARLTQTSARYAALTATEWPALFACADHNMLLPGWFLALRRRGWLDHMPADLRDASEATWLLNRDRNRKLIHAAHTVSAQLAEIDMPHVYLKGMGHILRNLHGDLGARMTSDLDLLLPEDRIEEAAQHLLARGAHWVDGSGHPTGHITYSRQHLPPLRATPSGPNIELHYDFVRRRRIWPGSAEILTQRTPLTSPLADLGAQSGVPRVDHAAALAMAHSFLRQPAFTKGELHLKDIWDFLQLVTGHHLDLAQLQKQNNQARQGLAFATLLQCADYFFGFDPAAYGLGQHDQRHRRAGRLALTYLIHRRQPRHTGSYAPLNLLSNLRSGALLLSHRGYRQHAAALLRDPAYRKRWQDSWRSR